MVEKLTLEGGKGNLWAVLQKPELAEGQKCPLVVLMHGFMANCRMEPIKGLAAELEKKGIATLRFDFNGHGRSQGKFSDMNVLNEIDDALMVWDHINKYDWVSKVGFVGHSQGGVITGMTAGMLGNDDNGQPKVGCIVQLAPAAVLKDDCINGCIMGKKFDPKNPPEHVWMFFHKLGRSYITCGQRLKIYETSAEYEGPACIIHGKEDDIVPYSYGEKYHEVYKNSELHLLDGETHFLNKRREEVFELTVDFLVKNLL